MRESCCYMCVSVCVREHVGRWGRRRRRRREGLEEMGLLLRSLSKSWKGIKVSILQHRCAHIHIKQEEESGLKTKYCRKCWRHRFIIKSLTYLQVFFSLFLSLPASLLFPSFITLLHLVSPSSWASKLLSILPSVVASPPLNSKAEE